MVGGAETPNIAALPAIARLGTCESARGPDADRHVKLLIQFAVEGSLSGACSHLAATIGRQKHNLCPPNVLLRAIAVGDHCLKAATLRPAQMDVRSLVHPLDSHTGG